MRPTADLKFILARTREYMADHPPLGPLLVETERPRGRPAVATCPRGHSEWLMRPDGGRRCAVCTRERQRTRQAERRGR